MSENENREKQEQEVLKDETQNAKNETDNTEKHSAEIETTEENNEEEEGLDYSGMLDKEDIIQIGDSKFKIKDIEKIVEKANKHKDVLEQIEKNPDLISGITQIATNQPISQTGELTEEQKVLVDLLQREYEREWEKVKDKYPLVEADEVWAKLAQSPNKEPSQVEKVAQKLQAYFEKKLEMKEKTKKETAQKAKQINFETGESPIPEKEKEDEFVDIEDTSKIVNITKNFLRKKD